VRLVFLLLLVALLVSVVVAKALATPGFVLLAWGHTSVELPLFDAAVLALLAFLVGYLLLRLLANLVEGPHRVQRRWTELQRARARRQFYDGLLALSQGRWAEAERLLLRSVRHHDTPLLGYLAAARAAHMQQAFERRDDYLRRAIEADPDAELAVGLQQAELQLSRHQYEQALATLTHLRELAPRHPYVLFLLARLHRKLGDWGALKDLVTDLRKARGVPRDLLDEADAEATRHLLLQAGDRGDHEAVDRLWKTLPRPLRKEPSLVAARARALDACGQHELAVDELLAAIDRQWDAELVDLLGRLRPRDPMRVLGHAEGWLKQRGNDAVLLRTLGRLSLAAELWGKARRYLETALDLRPDPETCRLLGELLERLGETDAARDCYRRGLSLVATEAAPRLPGGPREGHAGNDEGVSASPTLTLLGQ